jgi:hypothetical protein
VSSHLRLDDGTTWPDPGDPDDVQWQLRYGEPSREQMVFAASVLAAYGRLGLGPGNRQLPALRRAAKAAVRGRTAESRSSNPTPLEGAE